MFRLPARALFLLRVLPVAAAAFGVGFVTMGALSDRTMFRPTLVEASSGGAGPVDQQVLQLAPTALNHWRTTRHFVSHVPGVCWGDNAVNDFQRRQCGDFWEHLQYSVVLSLLPFLLALASVWLAWKAIRRFYRVASKRIRSGQAKQLGIVTDPAQAPGDAFSWIFCLRPISVQLGNKTQVKTYLPLDSVVPLPGEKLALFEPISALGKERCVAVVYAPHVAVVHGVRQ